jgi:hypothetical protein
MTAEAVLPRGVQGGPNCLACSGVYQVVRCVLSGVKVTPFRAHGHGKHGVVSKWDVFT